MLWVTCQVPWSCVGVGRGIEDEPGGEEVVVSGLDRRRREGRRRDIVDGAGGGVAAIAAAAGDESEEVGWLGDVIVACVIDREDSDIQGHCKMLCSQWVEGGLEV